MCAHARRAGGNFMRVKSHLPHSAVTERAFVRSRDVSPGDVADKESYRAIGRSRLSFFARDTREDFLGNGRAAVTARPAARSRTNTGPHPSARIEAEPVCRHAARANRPSR